MTPHNTPYKRRLALLAIQEYRKTYGWYPTQKELGEILGVSAQVALKRVHELADDGKIWLEEGKHRNIRLMEE